MKRRDAGFTLLEMLVALVVFGLVMAGLAQTFRFGLTAWNFSTSSAVFPENMASLDSAVAAMILQAQPSSLTGHPHDFAFTTRLPAGAGLKGALAEVAIATAPDGKLWLRYAPHAPGIPITPPPAPASEPLATGVAALSLSYLIKKPGAAPVWSSTWSGRGLPLLIRIHIDFTNGQIWPDLVAAPIGGGN
jgi:general secretion pathway protein J